MSEEIDLDANNLTEDAFEKFQSKVFEEEDYVTLSDIVPPQPSVPDHSHELNEIPYDNEVVLGSQNYEGQVNSRIANAPELLDISENNAFNDHRLDTCGGGYYNDDSSKDLEMVTSQTPYKSQCQDLSSDGLGAQNYVIEDSESIIQDSLLSTTVGQSDVSYETLSEVTDTSSYLRRTKRGRIPNTSKYPMTSATDTNTCKNTGKRRPGRPKKVPLVQNTSEPDSTIIDSSSLFPENGSVTDGSGLDESTSSNVKKSRRGRPKKEDSASTPSKRGRKPKVITIVNEEHVTIENNSYMSEISDSTKQDIDSETQIDLDLSDPKSEVNSLTLSTSKRKKKGPAKGKKKSLESANKLENTVSGQNYSDLDDADDVCLSELKQGKTEIETISNSKDVAISAADVQNDVDNYPIESAIESKPIDDIETRLEGKQIDINGTTTMLTDDNDENNIPLAEMSSNSLKRNSKMPIMSDFEYNVDKAVKEATVDEQSNVSADMECLLVEDTSKRRRTVKKTFVYDEGSDEDPFANLESSDDEPKRRKKGNKYNSDDEYVPSVDGRKRGRGKIRSSSSESDELHDELDDMTKKKKKTLGSSPFKKGMKPLSNKSLASNVTTIPVEAKSIVSTITPKAEDDDIEGCLQTTMIKVDESLKPPAEAWATSNEFENFIAKKTHGTSLKIKKVSSKEVTETLAPLDIPVVHQNEPKKTAELSTQTKKASTSCISVQTSAPYDIPMKSNINLTAAQSEKACEFLSSVVKTTVELGQLMSQKSDDFMKKKINTLHVTDTMKMDYCVRKSFLLFKLAKHNLMQMEDDLANQYDAFLKEHNLSSCREQPKSVTPKVQPKEDSDSDCEIVEVVGASGSGIKENKSKFNPKTVFLNKELSIKIAKKPNAPEKPCPGKKKLDIKGRHAVWINKNVMVKKVTPTQSFLAQDSRNKKPPDYVTEKMVSDFFEGYNRKKALLICAPFINTSWTSVQRVYACHYFINEMDAANTSCNNNNLDASPTENNIETPDASDVNSNFNEITKSENSKSLFSLCIEVIRKCSHIKNDQAQATQNLTCNVTDGTPTKKPVTLFRLCVNTLRAALIQKKIQEDSDIVERNNLLDLPDQNNTESTQYTTEEMEYWSNQYNEKDSILCETPCEYNVQVAEGNPMQDAVLPLTRICYKKIVKMLSESGTYMKICPTTIPEEVAFNNVISMNNYYNIDEDDLLDQEGLALCSSAEENSSSDETFHVNNKTKSLMSLCVELIQSLQKLPTSRTSTSYFNPCEFKSLKSIAFENIKQILYPRDSEEHQSKKSSNEPAFDLETNNECETNENFIINCVNTLSEEAFQSLQVPLKIRIRKQSQGSSNFSDGIDNDCCSDPDDFNADHEADDNGWASQLQMQEFRSCFTPNVDTTENITNENNETQEELHEHQIKSEPVDYFPEENIDTSIVKTEPLQGLHTLNEMTHIPDSFITKNEVVESTNDTDGSHIQSISSYNVETFEQFVRSNKMIRSMDEPGDEIFSQSGLRVRRQHEPDLEQDHDTSMSLLVPHTFEPLHLVDAKGVLMESSSDDSVSYKKITGKKKDKRKKKTKKDTKAINSKETPIVKEKIVPENEVATLTRKMREKIRQEEKKIVSSDSESDNLLILSSKKDKNKKDKIGTEEKNIVSSGSESEALYTLNIIEDEMPENKIKKNKHSKEKKQKNYDVQCNNVDSTEKVSEDSKKTHKETDQFSGFTAIDQNEISNYHKLMQFVYDKIMPSDNEAIDNDQVDDTLEDVNDTGPVFNPDEPVELLECEPNILMFDDKPNKHSGPKKSKNNNKDNAGAEKVNSKFTDRHGWHCYPIDSNETKLYKNAQIILEKLPESFVDTYMEYQNVMNKDLDDQEVDRLINLQSLNRSVSIKDIKDGKSKIRPKSVRKEASTSGQNSSNISRSPSPTYSDNFDELAASDDEGPTVEDEIPPAMPLRSSENNLAKNLLMDDHDSDSDNGGCKIKQELRDTDDKPEKPGRPGPKSKTRVDNIDSESLMLTADKMMNKELNLLHAPIVLQNTHKEITVKENICKEETKTSKKSSTKNAKDRVKNDDDSSSEEEKQWVSTKEKLLKRMGKKDNAVADDAKRAKLVNEFIERRNESDRKDKRESNRGRKGRARRKLLERQKQLRFLSNELYNDGDGVVTGKRGAAAGLFKGRRNIRKVIDKKSLARSTVVANMEEFERKRRLNMRQNKLREVLGCEEGVNVLVINDEVCLEYDFEEQRPVVTVHKFFTKVMKAHQYEGVKFMWDACFESLGTIESGHGGSGCILAHCMGLGKTLQVLALLHTVLTHPRANMHRVLVCCPLSTVLNWVDEIHKWIGPVTHEIKVFELSKLRKTYERAYQLEDWYSGGGIFIIGYELFRSLTTLDPEIDEIRPTIINKIRTALLDPGPDIIVCDEGHLLKNDCSVLAVAMSRVVTKRRIVLTGTPMQNNLREYFCMVNFIKPNLLGTYSEYSNRFENPIMNGQHRDSREEDIKLMKARTHILHKVLEGCLQRQEASVLYPYLPKKHEYTVFIPLTQCQWDLYNHYMDNYAKTSKQSVLRDFHILQKIWSHPQVLHSFQMKARDKKDKIKAEKIEDDLALADQEADIKPAETEVWWLQYLGEGAMLNSLDSSNKFVAVFRILQECVALGDKVLIFSTSLFCLDALEYFLKEINKWSLGQEYYRLDGSVPAEVRQKWCREFNAENNIQTKLFLISTRAGCLGLNMTAANRVIILDTSWNPAHDIQSIFRVYRFGQKKDCYIYRLVALGTMEQKIYERSVTKQAVACRVVDEQQIDRHYNLAELTELYSVDEMGLSVAGGVAVGVGDVALLRVARDAAIHAVHEHDSLLRGSGEQGLPEHERAAAWNQFQQEHEHKQMQNDISANKAVVALKRLEMEHLRQQALYSTTEAPPVIVKIEQPAGNHSLHVPLEETVRGNKGKKHKSSKTDNRLTSGPQPGPSTADPYEIQNEMVQKITNLLIKHNFMQKTSGPRQISDLVAKVKRMVATRQPIALGPGYDELSSSIANVLLHNDVSMPALTDVEPPPEHETRKRGRPKKQITEPNTPQTPPIEIPVQETDGRKQRKAALAARMNFDTQHDVIDLDDDGDDWQNDTQTVDSEAETVPPEPEKPKKKSKTTAAKDDSSIVLSDDEPPPKVIAPADPAPTIDNDVVPLHPSLLTNSNFIKIVAHTYLAGNPMMDEDAATLAAQYSTLKTLKEAESEGKPIDSGPVYDIAIQVLGKDVLRKLQAANPKSSGEANSASSLLGGNTSPAPPPAPPPAPTVKKPKIGPKSKVMKEVKQETTITRLDNTKTLTKTMFTTKAISAPTSVMSSNVPPPREESILPDEEVITSEPTPTLHVDGKTIVLRKVKLELKSFPKEASPAMPVRLGRGPAPQALPPQAPPSSDDTICLDSDDESTPVQAPPPRRQRTIIQMPTMVPAHRFAPVPVALTGPNSRPLPLPPSTLSTSSSSGLQPAYYTLSSCGTRAIRLNSIQPVPVSKSDPNGPFQPIPASFLGPGSSRSESQVHSVARSQPVPVSLVGPNSQPMPISLSGPGNQGSLTYGAPASQPVPISVVESSGLPLAITNRSVGGGLTLRFATQQAPSPQSSQNVSTPSASGLARAPRIYRSNTSAVGPTKTVAKPGEVQPSNKMGFIDVLNHKLAKSSSKVFTHTETAPTPVAPKLAPKAAVETVPAATSRGNQKEVPRRPIRRASSSSSSSSRSSSPTDPLAILKDVVHIQAPSKQTPPPKATVQKPPQKPVSNTWSASPTTTSSRIKTDAKPKEKVGGSVNITEVYFGSDKTKSAKKQSGSVDLSSLPTKPGLKQSPRHDPSKDIISRVNSSKKSGPFKISYSTPPVKGKTSQSVPSKLVGTSKSIILDGKSKSLKVENKNVGAPTITSSKILPNISKQKLADKRPSPSTSAPASKKKKTELMTLKDFDIDDIDDIIELD